MSQREARLTLLIAGALWMLFGLGLALLGENPPDGLPAIIAWLLYLHATAVRHPDSEAVRAPRGDAGETPG